MTNRNCLRKTSLDCGTKDLLGPGQLRIAPLCTLLLLIMLPMRSIAQAPPDPNAGIQLWSTEDFDIDLATSAVNVRIPLRSKIGIIPFTSYLFGTSQAFKSTVGGSQDIYPSLGLNYFDTTSAVLQDSISSSGTCIGSTQTFNIYKYFVVADETGANHSLPLSFWKLSSACGNIPAAVTTSDGSGYTLVPGTSGSYVLYDRRGWHLSTPGGCGDTFCAPGAWVDPDGNTIASYQYSGGSVTDTLGATALRFNWSSGFLVSYSYADKNGGNQYYTPSNPTMNIRENFVCQYWADWSWSTKMLTSMALPDGGHYTFAYEPTPNGNGFTNTTPPTYFTGRIAKITYPTGGSISYAYSGGNNGFDCNTAVVPTLTVTINDNNGHSSTYTYVNSNINITHTNFTVVRTDPGGNQTIYYFAGEFQTQIATYQGGCPTTTATGCAGGGALLTNKLTCYNGNFTNCATPSSAPVLPVKQTDVYTSVNGSAPNLVETVYDCKASPTACYGNVVQMSQYDFGASTPTLQTYIYYGQSWNGSNGCNPYPSGTHISNTPCYIDVKNGSSDISITNITYSNTGHPISTARLASGTSYLTSTATYNSNGTISWSQDVAGNQTTFAYNGNGGCNGVLPTSITPAIAAAAVTLTWDCNGGVLTSYTDANQATTSYGYTNEPTAGSIADPLWRRLSVTDPLGNVTWTDYSAGSVHPKTVDTHLDFSVGTPTSTDDNFVTLDGLGRTIKTKKRTAPGASTFDDTVQYTYGWNATGSFVSQTIPGGTAVTTQQMDAASRIASVSDGGGGTLTHTYSQNDDLAVLGPPPIGESNKQVQNEHDGLGRLIFSCQISSSVSGGVSCGEKTNTTTVGVVTSTSYSFGPATTTVSSTRGVQTHTVVKDGIGRVTSKKFPESGTVTYVYDSDPSADACGANRVPSAGLLMRVNRQDQSYICYQYDSLGRVVAVGNSAQSSVNAEGSVNPCRHFRYDNSTGVLGTRPTVVSPQNSLGRLVEAETDTCAVPITQSSILTDEWFSYDADGRITDVWESTPHSNGYFHTSATYWANGQLATLNIPAKGTYSIGVDGEGRPYSATWGSAVIINSLHRNSAGQPTSKGYASGADADTYQYDPNTGRMTKYTFAVGSTSNSGTLTWNPNGTLQKLAIVDGFKASGTETCTFSYDDIGRLITDNCGSSLWNQTYGYDQYDNLTKTGNPGTSWIPNYNPVNNQENVSTYDANGNILWNNQYYYFTWNVYGQIASGVIGDQPPPCPQLGTCWAYDAFGRPAEALTANSSNGGDHWQVVYGPLGKVAKYLNTAQYYAYLPLPDGTTGTVRNDNAFYPTHVDWLGSSRWQSWIGGTITFDGAFTPYGEIYDWSGTANYEQFFTGDSQDFGSGFFHTPNREFNTNFGSRWLSPDPAGAGWNQYAYVTDPNRLTDRLGLIASGDGPCGVDCGGGGNGCDWGQCYGPDPCDWGQCGPGLLGGDLGQTTVPQGGRVAPGLPNSIFSGQDFPYFGPLSLGTLWSDVLGLPNGLSCPQVGGLSDFICGGVSPSMDAENNASGGKKSWPSYGTSSCQVYDNSGRPELGAICRFFGNSPISDSIRGCLQQHYDPNYSNGTGGYIEPGLPAGTNKFFINPIGGAVGPLTHLYCVPEGILNH